MAKSKIVSTTSLKDGKLLIIVESPNKVKNISNILNNIE